MTKQQIFEYMWLREPLFRVYVRASYCDIPVVGKDDMLALNFGQGINPPITGLMLTERGVGVNLSFDRGEAFCWIPWEAVFRMETPAHMGRAWPEDAPPGAARRLFWHIIDGGRNETTPTNCA